MREIPALKVRQWLPEWDSVRFDKDNRRRQPPQHFYLFSVSARNLRALSGIQRRTDVDRQIGNTDTGIQRRHDYRRSMEIQEYIRYGFPYAVFSKRDRLRYGREDSLMPGWLPTAIVVNIFDPDFPDARKGLRVCRGDHIRHRRWRWSLCYVASAQRICRYFMASQSIAAHRGHRRATSFVGYRRQD